MMNISSYKIVSFDCYGTLIDWEAAILNETRRLIGPTAHGLSDGEILSSFMEVEAECLRSQPDVRYSTLLKSAINEVVKLYEGGSYLEDVKGFIKSWRPFPDVLQALKYLSMRHRLVLLSNIDNQSLLDTCAGIDLDFYRLFTAEDIGSYKPATRNFEFLLNSLRSVGVTAKDILHVSVSRYHDIDPASACGIDTAWINRSGTVNGTFCIHSGYVPVSQPTYEFSTLSELELFYRKSM